MNPKLEANGTINPSANTSNPSQKYVNNLENGVNNWVYGNLDPQ